MSDVPWLVRALKDMPRPGTDEYFLLQALVASTKGTCARRKVGCVLVDVHGHVIATGYNGNAAGLAHCIDKPCPGAGLPSGTGLSECEALHAEENALIQCTRPNEIHSVYCMASPCIHCVRRLMNTAAKRIVFAEEYPHSMASNLWILSRAEFEGPTWIHLPWAQLPSIASIQAGPSEPGLSSLKAGISAMVMPLSRAGQSAGSKTPSS